MRPTPYVFTPRISFILSFAILFAYAFTAAAGANSTNTLKGAQDTIIGVGPNSIVTGDFNGDGRLDSAVSNQISSTVGVAFGKGDGGFLPATGYSLGAQPGQVIVGQFSNDSSLDLVALTSGGVKLLTNNGAGVFTINTYSTVFTANYVAAGDMNNDGRVDLVVANGSFVGVMLASPIGGFEAPTLFEMPNANITSIALGLMNADNNLDLVVTNSGLNRIAIMTGTGTGGLSAPVTFTAGASSQPSRLTLGDLNGDLKLDVVAIVQGATKVVFLAGDGLGAVAAPVLITPASADVFSYILLQDVNADTKLDILLAGYSSNTLCILYGNGTGGVAAEKVFMLTKAPRAVAAGDFNSDGLVDLSAVSEGTGVFTTLLNQGAGDFLTPKFVIPNVAAPYFADFNRDGKPDLILDTNVAGVRGVRFGNGDGTFQPPAAFPGFNRGTDFIVGYVNNDNFPDVVTSGGAGFSVMLNDGSGGFPSAISNSSAVGKLGLGDFDADAKIDLVMGQNSSFSPNLRVYKGDGLGNFALVAGDTVGTGIGSLTVADFNGDGKPDLHLSMSDFSGTVVKLLTSANTFGASNVITSNFCHPRVATPVAMDFNRDGKLDIASASTCFNGNAGNFAIFVGDGAGNFTYWGSFAGPGGGGQIADFNRDGNLDIGTIGQGEYGVAYGNGAGQFTVSSYAVGGSNGPAAAADFTGDGLPDVIFQGAINVPGMYALLSRSISRGIATADFDGDGKTDLSVFRPSTGTWYILRSSDNTFYGVQFGQNGDRPVPGDYDGDGKTDLAVFRNGDWYLLRSSDGGFVQQHHGSPGDIPVPADYNGDGITNFAVFRPSTGYWYTSTDPLINYGAVQWGANGDIPTPADYDGDGRADVGVFRPSGGTWYLLQSSAGFFQIQHGVNGDKPVPVDYDGDGRANVAVFRPANGTWYRSTNPATNYGAIQWGAGTDVLVPGYYDGDNQADVAIFRDGTWYIFYSSSQSYSFFNFGTAGDIPIPSAFVP